MTNVAQNPDDLSRPAAVGGAERQYPCGQCGAKLEYAPGTTALKCPYCAFENQIEGIAEAVVEEQDYAAAISSLERGASTQETMLVKCDACGAEVTPGANTTAFSCPYCNNNIVATAHSVKSIKPGAVLPFKVRRDESVQLFRKWISSRWFAPSQLKNRAGLDEGITGIYLPAWTYDSATRTAYTGARGTYYYTTEMYTTNVNGKPVTRSRQVRHTRWSGASGVVNNKFDDVLVLASKSLPAELVHKLEPWDLKSVVAYSDDYLSGFRAESYQVDLGAGFESARAMMNPVIRATIASDIGGDEQRIDTMKVQYNDITYKHLLLPVWISAYRYHNKVYRFLVNARTGEVQGDRPYSAWKIASLVVGILVAVLVIGLIASRQ